MSESIDITVLEGKYLFTTHVLFQEYLIISTTRMKLTFWKPGNN